MPMNCKGLCECHPKIFINHRPGFQIGKNVFFCKLCHKYIEIKELIKNELFKIKNKCICCKAKFRAKKSKTARSHKQFCKCGCGCKLDKLDSVGRNHSYIHGHNRRIKNIHDRKCGKCDKNTTAFFKNGSPKWKKYFDINGMLNYMCHTCYQNKRYYISKLKNLFKKLNYSAIMRMI